MRLQVGPSEATNKVGGIGTDSVVAGDCVWEWRSPQASLCLSEGAQEAFQNLRGRGR